MKLKQRPFLPPHTRSALAASTSRNISQLQDRSDDNRILYREFTSNTYRPCEGILCNRRPTPDQRQTPAVFSLCSKNGTSSDGYVCTLEYGRTPKRLCPVLFGIAKLDQWAHNRTGLLCASERRLQWIRDEGPVHMSLEVWRG